MYTKTAGLLTKYLCGTLTDEEFSILYSMMQMSEKRRVLWDNLHNQDWIDEQMARMKRVDVKKGWLKVISICPLKTSKEEKDECLNNFSKN